MATPLNHPVVGTVRADGTAVVNYQPTNTSMGTRVDQISVQGTAAGGLVLPACNVFVNANFICASMSGDQDTASDPPPVTLLPNDTLTLTWSGMQPGSQVAAYLIGAVL